MEKDFDSLHETYLSILKDVDQSLFDQSLNLIDDPKRRLSGLFLASEPDSYWESKNKVMIIGAETRAWYVRGDKEYTSIEDYTDLAMQTQKEFFYPFLDKRPTKIKFYNFAKSVADKSGKDGLIYCNLFCFSWKKGSPTKLLKNNRELFNEILSVSIKLLKAQINYFKPDVIIWANGVLTASYRKMVFPMSKCKTIPLSDTDIPNHHLWHFIYDDQYLCYRIHHPASRNKTTAKLAREKLIELLPPA